METGCVGRFTRLFAIFFCKKDWLEIYVAGSTVKPFACKIHTHSVSRLIEGTCIAHARSTHRFRKQANFILIEGDLHCALVCLYLVCLPGFQAVN